MSTNPRSIGWLGTGRMGAVMAARLIDAGEDVTVWNRTASKTGPLVAKGARAVERISDLGRPGRGDLRGARPAQR
jgi:3-hydroxyisobutyrate dehydrogenase-like beta-hydroxyacid dehydrogenase